MTGGVATSGLYLQQMNITTHFPDVPITALTVCRHRPRGASSYTLRSELLALRMWWRASGRNVRHVASLIAFQQRITTVLNSRSPNFHVPEKYRLPTNNRQRCGTTQNPWNCSGKLWRWCRILELTDFIQGLYQSHGLQFNALHFGERTGTRFQARFFQNKCYYSYTKIKHGLQSNQWIQHVSITV